MGTNQTKGKGRQQDRAFRCASLAAFAHQSLPHPGQGPQCGFDWQKREDVWDKVREELNELEVELAKDDAINSEKELGDFLFSVINAARLYHLNPDNALEQTNQKFIRRFGYVEQKAKEAGKELRDMTLGEMDDLWNEAKCQERKNDSQYNKSDNQ